MLYKKLDVVQKTLSALDYVTIKLLGILFSQIEFQAWSC